MSDRPALPAIARRSASYATSLAAMQARLAAPDLPALHALRTRDPDDPTLALLDAWAVTAEVLGFYEERIANEHYLATATEQRSLVELARLAGTAPRQALPAQAWLSYTVINDGVMEIPAGSAVQSLPGDGAQPQLFETGEPLQARAAWSRMAARQTQPQVVDETTTTLWFQGAALGLQPNGLLLLVPDDGEPRAVRIGTVMPLAAQDRTCVTLQSLPPPVPQRRAWRTPFETARALVAPLSRPAAGHPSSPQRLERSATEAFDPTDDTAMSLLAALHPAAAGALRRAVANNALAPGLPWQVLAFRVHAGVFGNQAPRRQVGPPPAASVEWTLNDADAQPREALAATLREAGDNLAISLALGGNPPVSTTVQRDGQMVDLDYPAADEKLAISFGDAGVELVFRARDASITLALPRGTPTLTLTQKGDSLGPVTLQSSGPRGERILALSGSFASRAPARFTEVPTEVALDTTYDAVVPQSWVVLDRPGGLLVTKVAKDGVRSLSRADYGITGKVTRLTLDQPWIAPEDSFATIRGTTVHAGPVPLLLAEEPIPDPLAGDSIPLAGLQEGLQPGRWLVVEGERADEAAGIRAAEVVMLAAVKQVAAPDRPGQALYSVLSITEPLAYAYKHEGLVVHGNVISASHGGARVEVLGSGDAGQAFQRFTLRQGAAAQPAGLAGGGTEPLTTLDITVNGMPWTEVPSLAEAGPDDRVYAVRADTAAGTTSILFGDGITGARLPTGQENIRAAYRSGGGPAGNVGAGQLTLLVSRPLNVDSVTNPLPASGGAPPEPPEDARTRIPLGLAALDRLVSVQDYTDLARCFAGIAKVAAVALPRRGGTLVHVTFAAAGGGLPPLGLAAGLQAALRQRGDPAQAVAVAPCRLKLVVLAAAVALRPGAAWEDVAPAIRAALLARLGFARREIAQPVHRSEVIATIQAVPGVAWLRLERLAFLAPDFNAEDLAALGTAGVADISAARTAAGSSIIPAEIAFLPDGIPDLMQLREIPA